MSTINRDGRKKREMRNLWKRNGTWYFRKLTQGITRSVSLQTTDVELAKTRRNKLEEATIKEKWDVLDAVGSRRNVASIGEVIERYQAATDLQLGPRAYEDNPWALRRILKLVRGVEVVDKLPLTVLDGALVRGWQRYCLEAAGEDLLKKDSAAVSCNSMLGQARSLFGKGPMQRGIYSGLVIPDLVEFMTLKRLKELPRDDYHKPDEDLIRRVWAGAGALRDGAFEGPRQPLDLQQRLWLAFYITAQTGLRRGEVWAMRYSWFVAGGVRTEFDSDFVTKGKRVRTVPVDPGLELECRRTALANGWPTGPTDLVLPGSRWEKEKLFKVLGHWMTALGWTRRQKAHELRKIWASDLLESGATPYAVQLSAGHRDMRTTTRYAARGTVKGIDQSARYAPAA